MFINRQAYIQPGTVVRNTCLRYFISVKQTNCIFAAQILVMKWLNLLIKYRLWIGLLFLALGIFVNVQAGFWPSFILYFIGIVLIMANTAT